MITTIKEMINLKDIGIVGPYETKLKIIDDRLMAGHVGERTAGLAMRECVIRNKGYKHEFCSLGKKDPEYAEANAINGDISFYNFGSLMNEWVDVKNSCFVSLSSLERFRRDGWYFFNAFTFSEKKHYFIIRANDAFHNFVNKENCEYKEYKNDLGITKGFIVRYEYLPSNTQAAGLEMYQGFEPENYHNLLYDIRKSLDANGYDKNKIMFTEKYDNLMLKY